MAIASAEYETWRRVSLTLQECLRRRIPDLYFRDHPSRLADRLRACSVIVYGASRVYYPTGPAELTRPPAITSPEMFDAALRHIIGETKAALAPFPDVLRGLGDYELAARYNPLFAEDIIRHVRAHPRPIQSIFFSEARVIETVVRGGGHLTERHFAFEARRALRVLRVDMSELLPEMLSAMQRILDQGARTE
jgi:hypothetical protein